MKNQKAFSLIEVLATLVVAGILASVALPNMRNFIMSNRITAKTNELVKAINFARLESISYPNVSFVIVPYDEKNWTSGCRIRRGLEEIKVFKFKNDQLAVTGPTSPLSVEYASRGRVRMPLDGSTIQFTICNSQDRQQYPNGQRIVIAPTGRVSSERIQCS